MKNGMNEAEASYGLFFWEASVKLQEALKSAIESL